jgi:porin
MYLLTGNASRSDINFLGINSDLPKTNSRREGERSMVFRNFVERSALIVTTSTFLCHATAVHADVEPREYLLGGWGGARAALVEDGIDIQSVLTTDLLRNSRGGLEKGSAALFNYDLSVAIDTEKLGGWADGTFFIYFLGNFGDSIGDRTGDTQGVSNIQAPTSFKLYEAWYNHDFYDGSLSVLAGLHDYNSEFDALEYSSSLINSSFGISPDISQVGPSIFPTTALAVRVKARPSETTYLQGAIYDGIPGDPNNSRGTHIRFDSQDGIFGAIEAGATSAVEASEDGYYKIALGGWTHTAEFEDFRGEIRDSNQGFYGIGELSLWREESGRGLGTFFQAGFTRGDRNQVQSYLGAGFAFQGPFEQRVEDLCSLGVAYARNSSQFRALSTDTETGELAVELTYRFQLTPYLAIQPDLQWVRDPGTSKELDDVLLVGVRAEVVL